MNKLAEESGLRTESGKAVRFVPPGASDPYYEVHLFETGQVQTRPESKHDLFNALCWLAFPKTKARINAMHAAEIPKEGGKRGRLRDLLTIFDEGGAFVQCAPAVEVLVREAKWRELFVERHREFRIVVLGHRAKRAIERGAACLKIKVGPGDDLDRIRAIAAAAPGIPLRLDPKPDYGRQDGQHQRPGRQRGTAVSPQRHQPQAR